VTSCQSLSAGRGRISKGIALQSAAAIVFRNIVPEQAQSAPTCERQVARGAKKLRRHPLIDESIVMSMAIRFAGIWL